MKRNDWTFEYTASKLAEAAKAKRLHHASRFDWWSAKKTETVKKVSESGIEVHDSVSNMGSNVSRGYQGPQIKIDSGLQRDLSECQQKIDEHMDAVTNYEGWLQVLSANPEARLQLHHDDYLFFFGE